METIKTLRIKKQLTQVEASKITNIPLRTFKLYENDESKVGNIKYNYIMEELSRYGRIDEEHGILSREQIEEICKEVLNEYDVEYAILFGSYAKENAGEKSDVDLLISTSASGLKFYEIVEKLRSGLGKRVDLLGLDQLYNNQELINEVLRYGVRIYAKKR